MSRIKREMSIELKEAYALYVRIDLELAEAYAQQHALKLKISSLRSQLMDAERARTKLRIKEGFL